MAKKELYLPELKKGYYIFWNICTQCYNSCTVEMKGDNGDGNRYFKYSKTSTDTGLTVMGENSADLKDNDLKIMIDIPAASSIKTSNNSSIITDSDGLTVGNVYSFCVEDYTDNDYNDIYINVVGWKKKG